MQDIADGLQYLGESSFKTIEALGYHTAHELLQRIPSRSFQPRSAERTEETYLPQNDIYISLTVKKPSAIALAAHPTLKITRCLGDYSTEAPTEVEPIPTLVPPLRSHPSIPSTNDSASVLGLEETAVTAYLAIGTNLGDRIKNLQDALASLPRISEESIGAEVTAQRFLHVTKCSQLYESEPMYVVDQPQFINGAIQVRSRLSPKTRLTSTADFNKPSTRFPASTSESGRVDARKGKDNGQRAAAY